MEEILKRKPLDRREFDKFEADDHLKKQKEIFDNLPADLVKKFNAEYIDANGGDAATITTAKITDIAVPTRQPFMACFFAIFCAVDV